MSGPKQGGDLFDFTKDGTKVPGDAGKQNAISSVASEHQKDLSTSDATDLQHAADNSAGGPDEPSVIEAVSGTGTALLQGIGEKYSESGGKERGSK